jgi:hypothetical protein
MNKHIFKRSQRQEPPIVWCGRSIPGNSDVTILSQAALGDDTAICKNCLKAAIRNLENKLK